MLHTLRRMVKGKLKGIVFDMDGTLTAPNQINFQEMRLRAGVPPFGDILQHVREMPPEKQAHALAMIEEVEKEGLIGMKLMPDLFPTLEVLHDKMGLKLALLTRNSDKSVQVLKDHGRLLDYFSIILTRSFVPTKPHPAPLQHICESWQVEPEEILMVGDMPDDVACGNSAGAISVLIRFADHNGPPLEKFPTPPSFQVSTLTELVDLVQSEFSGCAPIVSPA
eukprot:GCRY01001495.1.p1 GENE.GCRY01001495.1~~GCRY01001495.1.p1  ORF type:complete len:223 (-),score=31.00 GCRY01001495.1:93-761(-)